MSLILERDLDVMTYQYITKRDFLFRNIQNLYSKQMSWPETDLEVPVTQQYYVHTLFL